MYYICQIVMRLPVTYYSFHQVLLYLKYFFFLSYLKFFNVCDKILMLDAYNMEIVKTKF